MQNFVFNKKRVKNCRVHELSVGDRADTENGKADPVCVRPFHILRFHSSTFYEIKLGNSAKRLTFFHSCTLSSFFPKKTNSRGEYVLINLFSFSFNIEYELSYNRYIPSPIKLNFSGKRLECGANNNH